MTTLLSLDRRLIFSPFLQQAIAEPDRSNRSILLPLPMMDLIVRQEDGDTSQAHDLSVVAVRQQKNGHPNNPDARFDFTTACRSSFTSWSSL
jgi:hypothetical protein